MKRSLLFLRGLVIFLLCHNGTADEVDLEVQSGLMMKMLRDMANQTAADSLNLPANASSIRENITDTFSCENRTYGYYADVDNDCQIFHVCLPSQTARGRNITYRWSFICPNETIFNQEVLVCTRPEDAIECKDSPEYYDINKEIGKEGNKTRIVENPENNNKIEIINDIKDNKIFPSRNPENNIEITNNKHNKQFPSRNPTKRPVKQNYIVQQLIKDIVDEEMKDKVNLDFTDNEDVFPLVFNEAEGIENRDRIVITDERIDSDNERFNERDLNEYKDYNDRLILERSVGGLKRGSLRFSADV